MNAIVIAEFTMLLRNRLVATSALLVPLLFAGVLLINQQAFGGSATIAALLVIATGAFGVYITATTTLAARRQTLFLKRLRSTTASDPQILCGLTAPLILVNILQISIILGAITITGQGPDNLFLVVLTIALVQAFLLVCAVATAGRTSSPEHAQVTTLPLFFVIFGTACWITLTGTDTLPWVKRALPGGALTELMVTAWQGSTAPTLVLLLISLGWTAAAFLAARHLFIWDPRH